MKRCRIHIDPEFLEDLLHFPADVRIVEVTLAAYPRGQGWTCEPCPMEFVLEGRESLPACCEGDGKHPVLLNAIVHSANVTFEELEGPVGKEV